MGGAHPLPTGTTLGDVEGELRYLMSRYDTMRTRLVPRGDGPPWQVVCSRGEIDLEVADAGGSDPAEVAAQVAGQVEARYRATPFDHVHEWPVRMAVVHAGGECRFAVLVMSHLVLDGAAAVLMMAETDARTTTPVQGHPPARTGPPSVAARRRARQNAAALRHWDTHLRSVPGFTVPPSRRPAVPPSRRPRHWTGILHSTALPVALREVACA